MTQQFRRIAAWLGPHILPKSGGLHRAGWGFILTTSVGNSEVFFHSWQTGASKMVIVDNDRASLLPVAPSGQDL
jgi:hypothetical protein